MAKQIGVKKPGSTGSPPKPKPKIGIQGGGAAPKVCPGCGQPFTGKSCPACAGA